MAKTRSMTRNQKRDDDDDASSKKRIKTCDCWSDFHHDVLLMVLMQLGVIDFLAFRRVCKSWRSLALCNKNKLIMSRPPLSVSIDAIERTCHLVDSERRKLKINYSHSAGRICIGVTCGYLILCGKKVRNFWLVNPITRHELHFPPPFPDVEFYFPSLGAFLIFSPSMSRWVFVVFETRHDKIWFCMAGKQEWSSVSMDFSIHALQDFKGKIYALHSGCRLSEVTLYPTPKVTLLIAQKSLRGDFPYPVFVSAGGNLYATDMSINYWCKYIQEMNFSKMEWESREKAGEEYACFFSYSNHGAAVIRAEPWADRQSKYRRYARPDESGKGRLLSVKLWYFFHDCLDVNLLHES